MDLPWDALEDSIGDTRLTILPIKENLQNAVADRNCNYLVKTSRGERFFLSIASEQYPLTVASGVERIDAARAAVGVLYEGQIELPVRHGFYIRRSYALWRYRHALSRTKGIRFLQKRLLFPKVLGWLRNVSKQSVGFTDAGDYEAPLESLMQNERLGNSLREQATRAVHRIASGAAARVHVIQHGDLWIGNILLKDRLPIGESFTIIDWRGSIIDGYPFFDFTKLAASFGLSAMKVRPCIIDLSAAIGCDPNDAVTYLLCGLGRLGLNLDKFPEDRFIDLCHASYRYLEGAGFKLQKH